MTTQMDTISHKSPIELRQIHLVGIKARTNNQNEATQDQAKIGQTIARFWRENLGDEIPNRTAPECTFSVYTDYENGADGDYTYFYGQQVDSIENIPDGLDTLTIPAANYQQFTTRQGPMPDIVIGAWQSIWQMNDEQLGGKRAFVADFELYDEDATDPTNSVVKLFIGLGIE